MLLISTYVGDDGYDAMLVQVLFRLYYHARGRLHSLFSFFLVLIQKNP